MRHTILHGVLALLCASASAAAQDAASCDDPFAARCWHFEARTHAALEAWNYNASHEELYGIDEGITYGLRDGLLLTASQRVFYVSQRANDTWVLGLTIGVRPRVYQKGRMSVYLEANVGFSDAAIAAPPRGTRFNYLALAGGGALVRLRPRVSGVAGLQWVHLSNASLNGPSRNPDIEAIGLTTGVLLRF
jgi:hypothetical protein